jgi:hypothetical protein
MKPQVRTFSRAGRRLFRQVKMSPRMTFKAIVAMGFLLLGTAGVILAVGGCTSTYKIHVERLQGSRVVQQIEFTRLQAPEVFDRIDGLIPQVRYRLGTRLYPSEYVFAGQPSYRVTLLGPPRKHMAVDVGWVTDYKTLHQWQFNEQWVLAPDLEDGELMSKEYRVRLDELLEAADAALRLPPPAAPPQ